MALKFFENNNDLSLDVCSSFCRMGVKGEQTASHPLIGDSMNVMKEAHKITRATVDASPVKLSYRSLFRAALIDLHKKAKEMNQAELLRQDTIAKFEQRIAELKIILNGPDAQKYMVVCGDGHPMPIDFDAPNPKFPWTNVEGATKWNSVQFAKANAEKVVNGNSQVGKAVRVDHHIEWDMQNLCKLINDLNNVK